jgi:pyruvate dehydrogenase E2 component (dihydrolipoamide acetyltransferase)
MAEFRMPSRGTDMEAGTLIEWKVKPGNHIKRGDIIVEVETDKGVMIGTYIGFSAEGS